jgi:UDP-glucose 4-epimerase
MSRHSDSTRPGTVAVLGGRGFMGSHICRALVARGLPVRIFDKLYAGRKLVTDIESSVEIVEGDIARPDDVLAALEGADTLIHLVHTTVPGSSMEDPAYDVESNVVSSARWLPRLAETSIRRMVFVSSGGTIYGPPRNVPIAESHSTDPISSYGITKLMIEKYIAMYASLSAVDYVILRPSNIYGEGQHLNIGQGVIGVLADRALHGEPLEIWGTGESLRDYLYVEDFVTAVMHVMDYGGEHRIFNVSSGRGHSVRDIIDILSNVLGSKPEVEHKPARGFDVPINVLDSSLLRAETGWEPRVTLDEGVARVVAWLRREANA